MLHSFPHELSDRVIDFLHDDRLTLSASALTCRSWLPTARYHLWSHTCVLRWRLSSFLTLLDASPSLGPFITTLGLRTSTVPVIAKLDAAIFSHVLSKLRALKALYLRNWDLDDATSFAIATSTVFRSITSLSLVSCRFGSLDGFAALLSAPVLAHLHLEDSSMTKVNDAPHVATTATSLSLADVCLQGMPEVIDRIARSQAIRKFDIVVREKDEATVMASVVHMLSDSLSEFALTVDADNNLQAVFDEPGLPLDCLTQLRTCRFSFRLREMCVSTNRSLPWIITLLTELNSSCLQEVVLTIKADDMVDLRALDSECGIRESHPVHFDDLIALDWQRVDLWAGGYQSSVRLIIEGRGDPGLLWTYLANNFPGASRLVNCRKV